MVNPDIFLTAFFLRDGEERGTGLEVPVLLVSNLPVTKSPLRFSPPIGLLTFNPSPNIFLSLFELIRYKYSMKISAL